jgi:hypothetical protein
MFSTTVDFAADEILALCEQGDPGSEEIWRFGVLQLLDEYNSILRHQGIAPAARVFDEEPKLTGHSGLDAAFAALACWLATRDGWQEPLWARDPQRVSRPWWFVSTSQYGRSWAMVQSPGEFRIRGVFITNTALLRA